MINCFSPLKQLTGLKKIQNNHIPVKQLWMYDSPAESSDHRSQSPQWITPVAYYYIILILECVQSGATSELRCQQLNHRNSFKEKYQVSSERCCQLSNRADIQAEKDKRVLHKEWSLFFVQVDNKWVAASYSSSDICLCWFFCFFFLFVLLLLFGLHKSLLLTSTLLRPGSTTAPRTH